ncbi:MAG: methyltransferase domain-containing protein [Fibrobacter sp.]|nr:methyltransferase domain-containing protein [Fibrobacter sp.]
MKTLEETVAAAMDVSDRELLPFLPYILQDFWEIGANPDIIISLIEKQFDGHKKLKVLDLGCGKGAVSVKIAKRLGYECYGIDAIPDFINYAIAKAKEYNVSGLCKFEVGDIREKIKNLKDFDIIILGAIGQVFGDYYVTLTTLNHCLSENGTIIIDDGYIEDESSFSHPQMVKKQVLRNQINTAGIVLVDEVTAREDDKVIENYDLEFVHLEKRCRELMAQHPEKEDLFSNYIKTQKDEYNSLKFKVVGTTMVFKRKGLMTK